jgi:hypothetical protein
MRATCVQFVRPTIAIIVSLAAMLFAGESQADVTLVNDGKPVAMIYVSDASLLAIEGGNFDAKDRQAVARRDAVNELNAYLQKMSTARLIVAYVDDPASIKGPAIVLGPQAVALGAEPTKTTRSGEGFRLIVKGDRILIGGQSDEAVLFGVYELLNQLGVDWVMPGDIGEVVPRTKTVIVPDMDLAQAPDFLVRRLWYRGYPAPRLPEEGQRMQQWLRHMRSGSHTEVTSGTGGHYWPNLIQKHKAEFDKDPTMLALVRDANGNMVRRGPQIEATHPRVAELIAADIREAFDKNKWEKTAVAAFPIGPADGLGYSQSTEAALLGSGRIDPIVGAPDETDLLVLLANRVFENLGDAYPNVYLGFYSYSTHADYPQRYKPHPRLVQIFAPINFSRYHGIGDANSKTWPYYKDVVSQWGELSRQQGNPLWYRGYGWNLAENLVPYTKVRIWGEELPFYAEQNFVGLNVETTKGWALWGPSEYVFMRLAWNADQDWRELLNQYCQRAYGNGAEAMLRYYHRQIETQHNSGQEAGSFHAIHLIYDRNYIAASKRDMVEALKKAATPEQKTRIQYMADGLKALELYLDYHDATATFNWQKTKAAYDAMLSHWQVMYDTNTDLVSNEGPAYLKRFLQGFVDGAIKYSTGEYKMAHQVPDALPTLFDPHDVGQTLGYQRPEINDKDFIRTRTFSTTWDAQGLGAMREATVWYRVHFELKKDARGKPVGLFLGGFEDEARVWINGEFVGTSGQRFGMPAEFDLTDGVKYEGNNVVAIQIIRNSKANEIGLGGLLQPSFIFTGPRLETKAPKQMEFRRVLPGGELGAVER